MPIMRKIRTSKGAAELLWAAQIVDQNVPIQGLLQKIRNAE
jgi:hypothetical protein